MKRIIFLFLGFLLLSWVYSPPTSQAANLVQNGDFETGNLTGWTPSGNTAFTGVNALYPHSGTYAVQLGPIGSDGFLSQVLATSPGQSYTISFWLKNGQTLNDATGPNDFHLSWGSSELLSLVNAPLSGYTQYTFVEQATTSSTTLTVGGFRNDPTFFYLDDIDVSPVPIPGAVWLFGSGLAGLVGIGRRRMRK